MSKETSETTKARLIELIGKSHPVYLPESEFAQKALKSMGNLSVDTLTYIFHLTAPIQKRK